MPNPQCVGYVRLLLNRHLILNVDAIVLHGKKHGSWNKDEIAKALGAMIESKEIRFDRGEVYFA